MATLREELTGTWFRSFEEETEAGELVFRPPDYSFPPARAPRPALRLEGDGTAAELRGGPADQLAQRHEGPGRWTLEGSTLSLRTAQLSGEYAVEAVDPDRLVVRLRPDSAEPPISTP